MMLWLAKTLPLLIKELNDPTDQLQCEDAVCVCVCVCGLISQNVCECVFYAEATEFVRTHNNLL